MTRYGGLGRTRPKKLTPKASIPIVREEDIDALDEDIQNHQQIETGVEKAEESEFHLQVAINLTAQGKVNDAHIPTPETILSNLRYDELYPPLFSQPATYIRSSATVEDCCGCPYNMSEEDDVFLKIFNQKRDGSQRCSEDNFEVTMNFFEETAQAKQPFAAVDSPPVLSYAEMEEAMDSAVEQAVKQFAKDIYPHWKSRRTEEGGNQSLEPSLKFETGQDTDDSDPYVCFRRREVRQIRKTRGRDAQSAEKLRRLRKELEEARQLVGLVYQREVARKEMLAVEKKIFLQRAEVRDMKRKLNIKDNDEDLINQKPKKKQVEVPPGQRANAPQLRLPLKAGLQGAEDLQLLEDVLSEKENEIFTDVKANIAKHIRWNEGFVDHTRAPLSPQEHSFDSAAFRPAFTAQLPTPPSSMESGDMMDTSLDVTRALSIREKPAFGSMDGLMEMHTEPHRMPSYRRRVGRGGRLMIDRRNFAARFATDMDPVKADRFKFDQEDSDEDLVFETDQFSIQIMQHRALTMAKAREQAAVAAHHAHAQAQAQAAQVQAQRRLQGDQPGNQNPVAPPPPSAVTVSEA